MHRTPKTAVDLSLSPLSFVLTEPQLFPVKTRADIVTFDFIRLSPLFHQLKYKADYVKQRGHYVGVASMRDDPKLVWFEHAGEIQNERLYKSDYHKTKSKIHIPSDMMSVVAAKDCQNLVSNVDYRQYLHEWTCHPDQNDCIQARKAYDLQSDVSDGTNVLCNLHLLWSQGVVHIRTGKCHLELKNFFPFESSFMI